MSSKFLFFCHFLGVFHGKKTDVLFKQLKKDNTRISLFPFRGKNDISCVCPLILRRHSPASSD